MNPQATPDPRHQPGPDRVDRRPVATARPPDATPIVPVDINVRSIALTILATVAGVYLLHWAQQVFVPVVLAILISYALEPVVRSLMRARIPRPVASAAAVGFLVVSLLSGIYAFTDDAQTIVAKLPDAAQTLRRVLNEERGTRAIDHVQRAAEELQVTADEAAVRNPAPADVQRVQIEEPAIDLRQYVMWGSAGIALFVAQAVLVMFFVFFLLASGDLFKRKLVRIAGPSLQQKKITVQILEDINTQIARFLLHPRLHERHRRPRELGRLQPARTRAGRPSGGSSRACSTSCPTSDR
jgi:predicted PurR-regulated permease PerM